eukprot:4990736-Prymnesium_polylepis.1
MSPVATFVRFFVFSAAAAAAPKRREHSPDGLVQVWLLVYACSRLAGAGLAPNLQESRMILRSSPPCTGPPAKLRQRGSAFVEPKTPLCTTSKKRR